MSRVLVAPLVALALVAAACGGDDDSADEPAADEPADDDGGDEPADDGGDEPADDGGDEPAADEPADDDGGDGGDEPADDGGDEPADDGGDEPAAMTPQRGGTLTYLVEAETTTWQPGGECILSCITVLRQVMDPLTVVNADGEVEPFLLESFEASDDFTEYTLRMREGVTFHDGTVADGAAVQRTLQEMARSPLQGQVLADLAGGADGIELLDPMTVKVTFSQPFATFPYNISERTGWLYAPSYLDDPDRAGARAVGTGPFEMAEWIPDERTVLEANPDYWRSDANGEQLPYLDGVVFRPIPDVATRRATMETGDADANHDSFAENRDFWFGEWLESGGQIVDAAPENEISYLLLNNAAPPFDNPDMRRALALCTDIDEYIVFRAPGAPKANGPFSEAALGYLEDNGFPAFDPEAGNALLDQIGRPAEILYGTTDVPANLLTAELFADMWNSNCGLNVTIDQFRQGDLVTRAITGNFQVFQWRNHGQGHPGLEFVWWHSRHAEGLALNFGRIKDAELDALLEQTWQTMDPVELDELGKQINQIFADNVYNVWLSETEWVIPHQGNVHGIGQLTLPSGNRAQSAIAGRTWLQEAWKES